MCEIVDGNDSRRAGWYCCTDNTWNDLEAGFCRTCRRPRHRPKVPEVRLALAIADDEPPCSDPDCPDCARAAARRLAEDEEES